MSNEKQTTTPKPAEELSSNDLLSVRALNQAAKMAEILQRGMTIIAKIAPDEALGVQNQLAKNALQVMECLGDLLNSLDMVEHVDLENVADLFKELRETLG